MIKRNINNIIYNICFLFRPITSVAVSFIFLVVTCILLVVSIVNVNENSKLYEILLAILTGVTASLLIAIMMELYNNYRFNSRRQRELREYFRCVARYEICQNSILKTISKYESDSLMGSGRSYAVFCQLKEIIPQLREVLNQRDYLYRTEIDEIDDILYNYDDLIKIIWAGLLSTYMGFISPRDDETDNSEIKEDFEKDDQESIREYPELFNFLKKEAMHYVEKNNPNLYEEAPGHLESVIEEAIFYNREIFNGYFEVTDDRYALAESVDDEGLENEIPLDKKKRFELRSNIISNACVNMDKAMIKLQKRVAKEPYFWVLAGHKANRE